MRFLVDANLAPRIASALTASGHDAIHVFDAGLATASDRTILEAAFAGNRIIVSSDADFGTLLAEYDRQKPSIGRGSVSVAFRSSAARNHQGGLCLSAFANDTVIAIGCS